MQVYGWEMQVHTGKNPAVGREVNQGARVVKDLVKEIEHSERNITCYNFFTGIPLARDLPKKKLTPVGNYSKKQTRVAFTIHSH